jgi:hypothetical protein
VSDGGKYPVCGLLRCIVLSGNLHRAEGLKFECSHKTFNVNELVLSEHGLYDRGSHWQPIAIETSVLSRDVPTGHTFGPIWEGLQGRVLSTSCRCLHSLIL